MRISERRFDEFKALMLKHVGGEEYIKLSERELYDKAVKLLRFVEIVERP